jgi:hypothetical protein
MDLDPLQASRRTGFWYPYRGTKVSLVANEDGTFSPRIAKVTLHSAGMLVERQIRVPPSVSRARFATRDAAAAAALGALDLDKPVAV